MDNLTYDAVSNYFSRVESVGYMSYENIKSLLALIYIYYFKENFDLTEEESRIVDNALSCLKGSNCLISYN